MKKKPTKRKVQRYLVIGNAHLGLDPTILKTLKQVADFYKAQVVHAGNLCTSEEKTMYERRVNRIRTFEKEAEEEYTRREEETEIDAHEILEDIKEAKQELKTAKKKKESEAKIRKWKNRIKNLEAKFNNRYAKLESFYRQNLDRKARIEGEVDLLFNSVANRVKTLEKHLGKVTFVANSEQYLESEKPEYVRGEYLELGSHLVVCSVHANGDKVSKQPITPRARGFLKTLKKSAIIPHQIPAVRSFPREGENQAWNYYTTGCLYFAKDPKRPTEFYQASSMPHALLVVVDEENGEFHASRLNFDYTNKTVILHDGVEFSAKAARILSPEEIAMYITDSHAPYNCPRSLAAYLLLCRLSKCQTVIQGGDFGDWESFSPHDLRTPAKRENRRLKDDLDAVREFMRVTGYPTEHVKHRIAIDANHEFWITRYINDHPELKGILDQETLYQDILDGWEYHIPKNGADYTRYWGDLALRHGHKESLNTAVDSFYKYLGGHFHSRNEIGRAGSSGASCLLSPAYLGGNLTNWQNCLTSITKVKGKTSFDIKSVLGNNGKARICWRGDVYEVDEVHLKHSKRLGRREDE